MELHLSQIIFQMINFGVVVAALNYLLYKPLRKVLDERSQRVAEAQKAAEQSLQEKASLEGVKKDAELAARKQAAQIIEEAKQTAQQTRQEILARAEAEAEKVIEKAQQQGMKQQEKVASEMREAFVKSVNSVVERILGAAFDEKTHAKLVDKELKAMLNQL